MERVEIPPGVHIDAAATLMVGRANLSGKAVTAAFNAIELEAAPGAKPEDIVGAYERACAEERERYAASPLGREAAWKAADEVRTLQAQADRLAVAVGVLDFADKDAVIAFFVELQPATDHIGVRVPTEAIVAVFAAHGLEPNMCVGPAFVETDAEVVFRWLVGQALDGLKNGSAIHGVFHMFAAQWRQRWGRAPQ